MARTPGLCRKDQISMLAILRPPAGTFAAPVVAAPPERLLAPSNSDRITMIAHHMAYQEMLRHDVVPYPASAADYGIDLLTLADGQVMKRVQIKAQEVMPDDAFRLKFSTSRSDGRPYAAHSLDAFIFVHIELRRYFVVPMDEMRQHKSSITFSPDRHGHWEDAWHVLKEKPYGAR